MTKTNKPVTRETHCAVRHKSRDVPVIITLNRSTLELRLKGVRSRGVTLAYDKLFKDTEVRAAMRAVGLSK